MSNRADRQLRVQFSTRFATTELWLPPRSETVLYADSVEHPFRATYEGEEAFREKGD